VAATDSTLNAALQAGIAEGENLINAKIANVGTFMNGWLVQPDYGIYGTNYLLRAATAKAGLGANAVIEALYPVAFTDASGKTLTGGTNYVMHFKPGQTPGVKGFWSITAYNSTQRLVPLLDWRIYTGVKVQFRWFACIHTASKSRAGKTEQLATDSY